MKIFLIILSLSFCFFAKAQQEHFIYLQSENKQPFFVKLNEKIYSSFESGYLIIPKLQNGMYNFGIGFLQSNSQQIFSYAINNKDVGFIIKNIDASQWQLYNMQTQSLVSSGKIITKKIPDSIPIESDAFSTMLAKVVHDSTILEKDIVINTPEPAKDSVLQNDSANVKSVVAIAKVPVKKKVKQKIKVKPQIGAEKNVVVKNDEPGNTKVRKDTALANVSNGLQDSSAANFAVKETPLKDVIKDSLQGFNEPENLKNVAKENLPESKVANDSLKIIAEFPNNVSTAQASKQKLKKKTKIISPPDVVNESPVIKTDTSQNITSVNQSSIPETKQKFKKKKKDVEPQPPVFIDAAVINEKSISKADSPPVVSANDEVSNSSSKQKIKKKKKNAEPSDLGVAQNPPVKQITEDSINKKDEAKSYTADNTTNFLSIIKRKSKKNTRDGMEMVYVDDDGETKDTIKVLMPIEKKKSIADNQAEKEKVENQATVNTQQKTENVQQKSIEPVVKSGMINSDCKNFATDEDFLKVRKKMVAENTDEDMIKAAKKIFKTKCFTTEQIKNLSVLFLKDDGKYLFFDAAYPFVSDSEMYPTLQSQLSDDYYITRFKAMIHK